MTEILLPRIARQGAVCLISRIGQARKARIEKFELDEGSRPYHPPLPKGGMRARGRRLTAFARSRCLPPARFRRGEDRPREIWRSLAAPPPIPYTILSMVYYIILYCTIPLPSRAPADTPTPLVAAGTRFASHNYRER